MNKKVDDKVKLNDTLLYDGVITKVNEEMKTYTVLWTYEHLGKKNKHYQLHYIDEFI